MQAHKGDVLVVPGRKVGNVERRGEIVDVRGTDGQPPYVVRWESDEQEHLFYPSAGALVQSRRR